MSSRSARPTAHRSAADSVATWLARHRTLPRLECELLLCHRLGIDRARVIAHPERALSPGECAALEADAIRLAAGEPFAYVTGEREFFGLTFEVSPDVLIPRPETETLVELALARLETGQRVLDLGTGSGAIAVALACRLDLDVTAVDLSPAALAVAARNASTHGVRVKFLHSDWFANVHGRFDLIAANPPYIAEGDPHLPALRYEPPRALTSGPAGLDAIRSIVPAARGHLSRGGWLLVEHGHTQGTQAREIFAAAGFGSIETVRDLGDRERITLGRWREVR